MLLQRNSFNLNCSTDSMSSQCNNMSTPIPEWYESFENAVEEVAEKVVDRYSPCGMPSWVSDRTKQLRTERDVAKRKYLLSKSKQSRGTWRKLNCSLNESYKADEMARLNKQMEELKLADSKGDYSTTWKIIHDLSGKDRNPKVKVKMRDGAPPKSDKDLLAEWQEYFSSLLNNDNGQAPSGLPQPAAQDLPIHDHPPTLEETLEAIRQMKTNKAAALDCAITAEALQGGGEAMADVIHCFCAEVYSNLTKPDQWITSVIVPLPKKGDLSLMTNYRGISLLSIAAKVYNKILLNRIRDEVDPILRKNQAGFRPGRSCAQKIHTFWEGSWKALEITSYRLLSPLLTSKSLWFHQQESHVCSSSTLCDSRSCSQCYQFALQKVKKRCDCGWRPIWSIWRHYWSPAGRCSGSFSICCAGWLPAEKGRSLTLEL